MIRKIFLIIERTCVCIIIALFLLLVVFSIKTLVSKGDTKFLGLYQYVVISDSMHNENSKDSIEKGDLIFVKKRSSDYYQVGMTVVFRRDNEKYPTTHQIIERDNDKIVTKGLSIDNDPDEPITVDKIIGEVVCVIHSYSKTINFIKSPLGLIISIGVIFLSSLGISKLDKFLQKREDWEYV